MGLSRQLVIFGIVIGGYQLIQSRSRGKDLEEYYNLKYGAESAGQKVRNRLQGADVGPQDEMLEDPSIYRDWAMVQKGYQSLRMMNDNDNFNSEEWHIKTGDEGDDCQECGNDLEGALGYDWVKSERLGGMGHLLCSTCHLQAGGNFKNAESFSSEWHYFSECETKGCDGDIEYRDVYACPSCGQDDVEILLGDTCPDCGETAEDVSKYAIFYCSDCEEDYTDMYNSEEGFDAESFAADARELYKTDPKELLELAKNEGLECVYCEGSSFHDPFATPYSKATGGATIYYPCDCGETQVVITDKKWGAESFSAHVYRGKPMSELGYAGRAMATQKMIKAADIEHSILQLEAAIKVGLISEDEIMDQLRKKFSE